MDYKVKAKVGEKFFTFGNVKDGKYGPRLGLKVSPELRQMIAAAAEGSWVNFSLYEDSGAPQQGPPRDEAPLVDEIPF